MTSPFNFCAQCFTRQIHECFKAVGYEKEGARIAEWLNLRGITAFVLTYRLAPRYHYPGPILDSYRSVRWVRSHAQDYKIDLDRFGMWGFSAGGHLVGIVGTHFDDGNPQATDPIDRVSDQPDFVISSYGGLTLAAGVGDSRMPGDLLHGEERKVWGDAGSAL